MAHHWRSSTEGYTLFPTGAAAFLGQRWNDVTIGNYFNHLLKYDDGRFARHRFFALNTKALQNGRMYVQQNPGDAQLTVDELRDMYSTTVQLSVEPGSTGSGSAVVWSTPLDYPPSFSPRTLICPENPEVDARLSMKTQLSPTEVFYVGMLKATDYWMRFEWQHRGSPHVHGMAWLPDVEQATDNIDSVKEEIIRYAIIRYANKVVTTINRAVAAPPPAHICNKSYLDVEDHHEDHHEATCQRHTRQRHTRCSEAYCRHEKRFGYPTT